MLGPMTGEQMGMPMELQINLNESMATGVFADLASVWHTPASFVLDFISVSQPAQPVSDGDGTPAHALLTGMVCARVRIPPEQIFPLIEALKAQGEQWLNESGRSEPPAAWAPTNPQQPIIEFNPKKEGDNGGQ